jgi:hypothetical protein
MRHQASQGHALRHRRRHARLGWLAWSANLLLAKALVFAYAQSVNHGWSAASATWDPSDVAGPLMASAAASQLEAADATVTSGDIQPASGGGQKQERPQAPEVAAAVNGTGEPVEGAESEPSCPAWLETYAEWHRTHRGAEGATYLVQYCTNDHPCNGAGA